MIMTRSEIISAEPYSHILRETCADEVAFVATGGKALKTYYRFATR